ncbi:MAG: hypothetical protein HMLKMBBP_01853 [Planctomycetes bacterium]|nr:hypothetical protein [Planctomycetota bacterium]
MPRRFAAVCAVLAASAAVAVRPADARDGGDPAPAQGGAAGCKAPPLPKPAPEGLALVAKAETETVQPGAPVTVKLSLVHRGKEGTIQVVRPGDGSDAGWREPWMWWEAAYVNELGEERPAEKVAMLRCGNFDPSWHDHIVALKPGDSVDVSDGPAHLSTRYEFQEPGKVRIRAWYSWGAGEHMSGPGTTPEMKKDLGAMHGVPAFEFPSNPVIVTIVRPVDVVLRVKRAPRTGRVERPEQFLEVEARGADGKPFALDPAAWTLTWEIAQSDVLPEGWDESWSAPAADAKPAVAPAHVLTDATPLVRRASYPWTFARPGRFRLAARLSETKESGARIRSAWVDVEVGK